MSEVLNSDWVILTKVKDELKHVYTQSHIQIYMNVVRILGARKGGAPERLHRY